MNIKDIYHFLKDMQEGIDCDDIRISFCNKKLYITAYKEMGNEYCSYRQIYPENLIEKHCTSGTLSTAKPFFIKKAKERFDGVENEKNKNPDDN